MKSLKVRVSIEAMYLSLPYPLGFRQQGALLILPSMLPSGDSPLASVKQAHDDAFVAPNSPHRPYLSSTSMRGVGKIGGFV